MDYCQKNGIGWIAWSWSGNGGSDSVLDLVYEFNKDSFTDWGKEIFNGENGIINTSKKAYQDDDYDYCEGCEVTAIGEDGSKWGWENGKSCRIDTVKCNLI